MKFLLDTNTVSYFVRGVPATVAHIVAQKRSDVGISAITLMELRYGVEKKRSKALAASIQAVLSGLAVLPFDREAALRAAELRATLEQKGIALEMADNQIAGHALALGAALVTTDAAFSRVKGLVVKDWSR